MLKILCVAFFLFALVSTLLAILNITSVYHQYNGHVTYQNVFLFEGGVKASYFAMLSGVSLLLSLCSASISKLLGE